MQKAYNVLKDSDYICFVIPKFFTDEECNNLIDKVKPLFQKANSNYPTYYRNNERFVEDNYELSKHIFQKAISYLPEQIFDSNEIWNLKELNTRIRFCRYLKEQYFNRHLDGIYHISENEQSKLTFMLYLNGNEDFTGGRTLFYKSKTDNEIWAEYHPQKGDLIVFDHNIWHEGEMLLSGEKYILRSDIIFKKSNESLNESKTNYQEGHLGYIWKLLKFNENIVLSSGRDKLIKVWDNKDSCIQKLENHQNSITCLEKISDDTFISGSRDKTISIWKYQDGKFNLNKSFQAHNATILSLCKINEEIFASAGADKNINFFNLEGEKLKSIEAHQDWIWNIMKLNKNTLVSCSEDKTIKIWDLNGYVCTHVLNDNYPVYSLVTDNNILFSGNYNGEINIFDINDFSVIKSFKAHQGIIKTIILFDSYLISGGEDNLIKIWNLKTVKCLKEYNHDNFVQSIIKINDNQILSASYDGKIKLWNLSL